MSKTRPVQTSQKWRTLRMLRRFSQTAFFILFLLLIGITASRTGSGFDAATSNDIPYPVEAFLDIDPLAGAIVLLSTWTIPGAMIFGLVVLFSAILFGRAFCGWICPMGAMNHFVSEVAPHPRGKARIEANQSRPYQRIKYYLLFGVLAAALFGSAVGGLIDPLCLATRGISLTLLPMFQWVLSGLLNASMATNSPLLQHAADNVYNISSGILLYQQGIVVAGGFFVSLLFVAVLVANRIIPRFWCRGFCPLGALLGLAGRFGILVLKKDNSDCDLCGKCQLHCQGAASPHSGDPWQRSECDLCLNCVSACHKQSIEFGLIGHKQGEQSLPNIRRRSVIASAVAGAVLVPAMRTGVLSSPLGRPDPACIRPPGALDEKGFLKHCIRCGQCMKICPNNALHPALDEAGIEGLWTPVLVPRIRYCEPTCTLCTQVCPTGAIRTITEKQKLGQSKEKMVRIGTAFIQRGRCLPWAMGTPCIVCEEFCPTSPKAIWFSHEEVEVQGQVVKLKRPHIDPRNCNGCGACEHVCPVHDKAAVRVSAVGESRSPKHELLLDRRVNETADKTGRTQS